MCSAGPCSQIRLGGFIPVPSPPGKFRNGGYDPELDTFFVGRGGHFDGMAEAGGKPDIRKTPGMSLLETDSRVVWANDSVSLPLPISETDAERIQRGSRRRFRGRWWSAYWRSGSEMVADEGAVEIEQLLAELSVAKGRRWAAGLQPGIATDVDSPQSPEEQRVIAELTNPAHLDALRALLGSPATQLNSPARAFFGRLLAAAERRALVVR